LAAALGDTGLVYAYRVARRGADVVFVPRSQLPGLLGS
jgi:hypothetical protein